MPKFECPNLLPKSYIYNVLLIGVWSQYKTFSKCWSEEWLMNIQEIIEVFCSPTNAQVIVLKTILKFTLKQLWHVLV